jgi:membrane fusion protein
MPRSLFRAESESARASAWLGRIVLTRPVSFMFMTFGALAVAGVLAAFFCFSEYTRKSRVSGVLAPTQGIVRIVAPQSGIVVAVHGREGESVDSDAPLFVIADLRANRSTEDVGAALAARVHARRKALQRQREHVVATLEAESVALMQRRTGLLREADQLDDEISSQVQRVALSTSGLERARRLESIGFLSPAAREHEEASRLENAARVEALRRTQLSLAREAQALQHEAATVRSRAEVQLAALDVQRASLDQEQVERDMQLHAVLVSPATGTLGSILVEPGQMVSAGTTLATLIPAGALLEAHLFTPSRSIGFVRDGQDVLLRFLAYPYQKFGSYRARVIAISKNPLLPGELGYSPPDGSREPLYRIKASLDAQNIRAYGREQSLQAGMQVEADIQLDRRRLIEWIFEPLLSLAGRA